MYEFEKKRLMKELEHMRGSFTEDQKEAYAAAMMGESLFLTGGPGTGKSYLTMALIKMFQITGKSLLIMAPTGIAAVHIGGTTIHRGLGLKSGEIIKEEKNGLSIKPKKCPLVDSADVVLVDEISMARRDIFEMLVKCIRSSEKRTGKHVQVILIGDFLQLPPVITPDSRTLLDRYYGTSVGRGYCFRSQEWKDLNMKTVVLTESVRQKDPEFIDALNRLRVGDKSCISYFNSLSGEDTSLSYLVPTNAKADSINDEKIRQLGEQLGQSPTVFEMAVEGNVRDSDMLVKRTISLHPGARVMLTMNDPGGRFQNGSCGKIDSFGTYNGMNTVNVLLDGTRFPVSVEPVTWKVTKTIVDEEGKIAQEECGSYTQIPVKLAYAISIHKSQGATFDGVNVDTDCWEASQLYVALSRIRSPEGVHLMQKIKPSAVIVDPAVISFYEQISGAYGESGDSDETDVSAVVPAEEQISEPKINEEKKESSIKKKRSAGRPTPFSEGTKRIRVGVSSADYIQEICRKQALEGGKIRWIPDELDICISDALEDKTDLNGITFMAVPVELEGLVRKEILRHRKINNK